MGMGPRVPIVVQSGPDSGERAQAENCDCLIFKADF